MLDILRARPKMVDSMLSMLKYLKWFMIDHDMSRYMTHVSVVINDIFAVVISLFFGLFCVLFDCGWVIQTIGCPASCQPFSQDSCSR